MALKEAPVVIAHLGGVAFIDSSGLGMLVRLMSSARTRGGDVKLCAIPELISRTLRMTNLHTVFDSYDTEGDAIAASHRRPRSPQAESAGTARTVLCFDESPDVLAYLREVLRRAGYNVVTTRMLPDAQVLLKATRPGLVILGSQVANRRERNARELFAQIAPGIPVFVLEEDFSTQDPGQAGAMLVEKVRHALPATA